MASRARLHALTQAHAHAQGLSPAELYPEGLTDLLAALARDTRAATGIRCRYRGQPTLRVADSNTALHLYHIARDAVQLALRHDRPQRIDLRLAEAENGDLTLSIQVDGNTAWDDDAPQDSHLPPLLRFRAGVLGGRLRIEPVSGDAVRLLCTIPAPEQHARGLARHNRAA